MLLNSSLFKNEKQIILVDTDMRQGNTQVVSSETTCVFPYFKVYMYEKVNNKWITLMETGGFIGKNGIGKEKEGDLKTPIGLYELGIAFGMESDINTKLDYYKLDKNMYWICDSNSKYYNCFVDVSKIDSDWDITKNEHLIEEEIAYKYAIEIKYNKERIPEKGSAIFLHCIKNGPTAGCVSISEESMKFILENVNKDTKIYIGSINEI